MLLTVVVSFVTELAAICIVTTVSATAFLLRSEVRGKLTLAINLSAANPHLDAQQADLRQSLSLAVVNISTESVQRRTAFLEHFLTCHFCTVQTSANLNLDTFSTSVHCIGNSHLDSTTVSNLAFYLTGDALTYDVCIQIRLLHFEDVNLNILVSNLLELFLELVNFLTTLADDYARA